MHQPSKRFWKEHFILSLEVSVTPHVTHKYENLKLIFAANSTVPIKDNILFLDLYLGIIKPQSRLDLLAIRAVAKNA